MLPQLRPGSISGGRRSRDKKERTSFSFGEARQVGATAAQEAPAAGATLDRINGNPSHAQSIQVAACSTFRNLELLGDLCGSDLFTSLQHQEDGNQTIRFHDLYTSRKPDTR